MAAFAKKTEHNTEFAKGGKTHMFGEQQAGPEPSGTTRPNDSAGPGDKFAKGGSGKMFGYAGSEPAKSGMTSAR